MNLNELENKYFRNKESVSLSLKLLLLRFINQLDQTPIKRNNVINALNDLLEYLVSEDGNTNLNCRVVDFVLSDKYFDSFDKLDLSPELKNIIDDLMWDLHDTHTSPEIAKEFNATPQQLLERLRKIL